jgi:hypothetical protein
LPRIVNGLEEEKIKVPYKMNNRHFEKTIGKIKEVWDQSSHGATFFIEMKRVMRWYKGFCIKKAKEFKQEEQLKIQLKVALS